MVFKQFEIQDEDERIIAGWATVQIKDKQGDIIPIDEVERAMYKLMDRGGHIMFAHANKPVGKILRWEIKKHPDTGKPGLWIVAKIHKHYKIDDIVWHLIKEGKLKGFSVGGQGKSKQVLMKDDSGKEMPVNVLHDIELMEISIVEEPANEYAKIEAINWFAKGETEVEEKESGMPYILKEDKFVVVDGDKRIEFEDIGKAELYVLTATITKQNGVELDIEKVLKAYDEIAKYDWIMDALVDDVARIMYDAMYDELEDAQKQTVRQMLQKWREYAALANTIINVEAGSMNEAGGNAITNIVLGDVEKDEDVLSKIMSKVARGEKLTEEEEKILSAAIDAAKKEDENITRDKISEIMSKVSRGEKLSEKERKILSAAIDAAKKAKDEMSKGEVEKKKDDCKNRYVEEDGRFKEMTCPDDPSQKSRFCGCVRYFMNCRGLSLESAKRMCGYIRHYVKKTGADELLVMDILDGLITEFGKEMLEEIAKPFAGFKNFEDCVRKMKEQGYDDESAHRICGKLYWEYEGKHKKGETKAQITKQEDEVRLKHRVAQILYGKNFDELSEDEQKKVHNVIVEVRQRVIRQLTPDIEPHMKGEAKEEEQKGEVLHSPITKVDEARDAVMEAYIKVKGLEGEIKELMKELDNLVSEGKIEKKEDLRPPKCISEDTYVLTKRGLVKATELRMDDVLLTFNMETGELEWQRPEGIEVIDYEGKMIEYDGARFNQLVTPEHEMVVRWMKKRRWHKRNVLDVMERGEYLECPLTGEWNCVAPVGIQVGSSVVDTLDLAKFAAWVVADGCLDFYKAEKNRNYDIVITQSKYVEDVKKIAERIAEQVNAITKSGRYGGVRVVEMPMNGKEGYRQIYSFRIGRKELFEFLRKTIYDGKEKRIPEWIKELPNNYLREFLIEYAKADGTFKKGGMFLIYTKSEKLRDDLIEVGLKAGYSVSYYKDERDGVWRITFKRAKVGRFRGKWREIDYKGKIVAIKTPNETIVIARKGKVSITGNSWWERCVEETGSPALCGWIFYHWLKPRKPESKKEPDKPHTREARARKRKWLAERNKGEVAITNKVEEVKKFVMSVRDELVKKEKNI